MKKRFLAIGVLALLLVFSCSKSNRNNRLIQGDWELRKAVGGFAGTQEFAPGNGNRIAFISATAFSRQWGNTSVTGTYELQPSAQTANYLLTLHYMQDGNRIDRSDSVRFDKSQLIFLPTETCCDIPTTYYERID